jgi:hypothetical protein
LHILPVEEREATTQSRFPDSRDRADRKGSRYPGIDFVRRRGEILFHEAVSLTILRSIVGRAPAARVLLPEIGKE